MKKSEIIHCLPWCRFCEFKTLRWRIVRGRKKSGFPILLQHCMHRHPKETMELLEYIEKRVQEWEDSIKR